jgi:hypothetical protein
VPGLMNTTRHKRVICFFVFFVFLLQETKNQYQNNLLSKFTQESQFQKKVQGEEEGRWWGTHFVLWSAHVLVQMEWEGKE